MKYQLLDKSNNNFGNKKGEFYLELMRLEIAENDKNRKQQWKQLQDSFLGELPNNGPAKPDTPTIEQWSDNHENSGWKAVESDIYRSPDKVKTNPMLAKLSVNKIPKYEFELHRYSDFKYEFERWFKERNQDVTWKYQIKIISSYKFNFNYLDLDSLSYNEMLFISLGFSPNALKNDAFFINFEMLGYKKNTFRDNLSEWLIQNTLEANLLFQKLDFQQERVETSKFIDWTKNKKLLVELGERTLHPNTESIIYRELLNSEYIDNCEQNEIWPWSKTKSDILLAYFILLLSNSRVISLNNPWKVMKPYVLQNGKTRLSKLRDRLKNSKPNGYKDIDKLVERIKMDL
jgi:DNA-binding Lrp family transcriptional regulator